MKSQRNGFFAVLGASLILGGAIALSGCGGGTSQQAAFAQTSETATGKAPEKAARVLAANLENLGPMASRTTVTLGPVTRLPNGDLLQIAFSFPDVKTKAATTPFDLIAVNLTTGKMTRTPSSQFSDDLGNDVWRAIWGPDGKLYIGTAGVPHLIRYDPVTAQAKDYGHLWKDNPRAKVLYSLVVGTDGALYGGAASDTNVMRFDPRTEKLDEHGPQGLPRDSYPAYAYSVGGDARYIYTASGKQPWYIVALDRQTGQQRNLLTLPNTAFPAIEQGRQKIYLKVAQNGKSTPYELRDGELKPLDSIPRGELYSYDAVSKKERPEVALDARTLAAQGKARLLYRQNGADHTVVFAASAQSYKIQRLTTLPDGRIFGATFPYGDQFYFDPKTGKRRIAGPTNVSVYSLLTAGNRVYISGYPSTPLLVFDPAKPWNFQRQIGTEAPPADDAATTNPHRVAYFNHANIGTHYGYFLAEGADGKIYVGAHAERSRNGGGLGIYDPKTGSATGLGEETFANYDVSGLAAAGRFIVYSSRWVKNPSRGKAAFDGAKLFVYDTSTGRIAGTFAPVEKALSTGAIVADGTSVVGIATDDKKQQFLYRLDAAGGETAYLHKLENNFDGPFKAGPDGDIWTFEKTAVNVRLVKIAPRTGAVTPIATIPFTATDFTFSGRDLYLANSDQLYRVRDVVAAK